MESEFINISNQFLSELYRLQLIGMYDFQSIRLKVNVSAAASCENFYLAFQPFEPMVLAKDPIGFYRRLTKEPAEFIKTTPILREFYQFFPRTDKDTQMCVMEYIFLLYNLSKRVVATTKTFKQRQ